MSSSKREAAKAQRESRNPLLLRQHCYLRVSVANLVVASERSLAESRDPSHQPFNPLRILLMNLCLDM